MAVLPTFLDTVEMDKLIHVNCQIVFLVLEYVRKCWYVDIANSLVLSSHIS